MAKTIRRATSAGLCAVLAASALAGCQTKPSASPPSASVIAAPQACASFKVAIYFESYSAAITSQAERLIEAAVRRTRGCDVLGVRITGLADTAGAPSANLVLSKRRADAVTADFHRRGIDRVAFLVSAAGDAGAQTAGGADKPLRRRAEVQFDLAAPR